MCKFCEGKYIENFYEMLTSDREEFAWIEHSCIKMEFSDYKYDVEASNSFKINFCPMCGKDLRD